MLLEQFVFVCAQGVHADMGWATRLLLLVLASLALFVALLMLVHRRDRRMLAVIDESNAQQQALIANLPGAAFRCRDDEYITMLFISDEIQRLSGYPASDFVDNADRSFRDVIHADDRVAAVDAIRQAAATGQSFELDFRLCHSNGTFVWVHAKARGMFDSQKKSRWVDGVLIDITQRRQAETDRERLTTAIEQSDETIVITDAEGVIKYVNPAFERITGYTRAEAIGQTSRLLKSGQHTESFYSEMWLSLASGRVWKGRIVNKRKDGTLYTEEANIAPVRDASGRIVNYVAVKRDITNELEAEQQRHQAQKMESVSRLAGGVAHSFNNMLQAILGHTEIALHIADPDNVLRDDLEAIRKAAQRSADLTRQLLTFGRKQTINPEVLNLNQAIGNTLKMLPEALGKKVSLDWHPAEHLWWVAMDPVQVDQMLVNLCVNARDAMTVPGTVAITTRNVNVSAEDVRQRTQRGPGDYVMLTVSDDAGGMDETTLAHIFEPFFTTKKTGRGTGMGLATLHGIVEQNHGFIEVDSTPGHGSSFKIYFPRLLTVEKEESQVVEAEELLSRKSAHTETILLVEDEPASLHVCRVMLENDGYHVIVAGNGDDAKRLTQECDGAIDLLLTDVIMPETNGYELARALQREWPELKCMFMSGYTADIIVRRGVVEDGLQFIQKPFTGAALKAKVRETLDKPIVVVPPRD